ncbi:MAG: cellulase family glycosylhydrolase, partial [Nitrososphaeraceae archaeon]
MENFLYGVNLHGFACAIRQNRVVTPKPPTEYINDSFNILKQAGIQCIRLPVYWESYEKNPEEFNQELDSISSLADKYGISCIYDNHQWECSSYFGRGIGFPNSLLTPSFGLDPPPTRNSSGQPTKQTLKEFWNQWWDRKLRITGGKDGWDAQLEFLEGVIKRVKDKNSTLGFEILNEPMVFRQADFRKVGIYHDYLIKNISALTDKTLFFCFTSSDPFSTLNVPWEQAKTKPSDNNATNNVIIFDVHPYPPNSLTMGYYKSISWMMKNISMYAGEFNAGINPGVRINARQFKDYVKTLKNSNVYGCAFWEWSYIPDKDHPAFNMTTITNDKIYPNSNFQSFADEIR